jgi:hypothetical protein
VIVIGVDYHPSMQQIAFVSTETGEYVERQLNHSTGEQETFYRDMKQRESACEWGWRPPGMHAGSNGSWRNWISSSGSEIQRRSRPRESASRRRTVRMLDCSCGCCPKIVFRAYGFPTHTIGICVSCCGIDIGWCR